MRRHRLSFCFITTPHIASNLIFSLIFQLKQSATPLCVTSTVLEGVNQSPVLPLSFRLPKFQQSDKNWKGGTFGLVISNNYNIFPFQSYNSSNFFFSRFMKKENINGYLLLKSECLPCPFLHKWQTLKEASTHCYLFPFIHVLANVYQFLKYVVYYWVLKNIFC